MGEILSDSLVRTFWHIFRYQRTAVMVSSTIYEDLMYQLPEKQSRVLIAVAKDGSAKNVTSGSFTKRHSLPSPNSVKSAIPALIDKGLLTQDKGVYKVYDLFFAIWLVKNC